jgi:predicted DNA-binding protein
VEAAPETHEGGGDSPDGKAGGRQTVQTSIRLSRHTDQSLDRLVAHLNGIREAGTEPWTRTEVMELALRDWWPFWLAGQSKAVQELGEALVASGMPAHEAAAPPAP